MKKIILSFCVFLGFVSLSNGANRDDSNKFSFNVSIGAAIPLRNFSKNNPQLISKNDTIAYGSAEIGFHFDISADWYFSNHIGISALFGGSLNSFNASAYNNSINFNESTATTANNFYLREYLFGFCYRFNIKPKIIMEAKVMVGDMEANFPNVNISFPPTSTQSAGTDIWTIRSSDAFVGCFNADIKYALSKHICLVGNLSYSTTTIKYPYYTLSQTLQGGSTLTISNGTPLYMSLGLLKPAIGVSYFF